MRYLILAALLLVGGTSASQDDLEEDDRKRNDCIAIKNYSRMYFQAITDYSMYVRSANDQYLVSFDGRCSNISDGYNISFDTRSMRVCSNSRPKVAYYYRNIDMPSCRVASIQQVMSPQEAMGIASEEDQVRRAAEAEKRKEKREKKRAKKKEKERKKKEKEKEKEEEKETD